MLHQFQHRTFNSGHEAFFKELYRKYLLISYWLYYSLQYFAHINTSSAPTFRAFRSQETQL